MGKCIFLYNPGAPYIEEIVKVLQTLNLNIREIEANSDIVSNLVPNVLQRGAASWLIFFLPDKQGEWLILPFPDENPLQHAPDFRGYLADLIPLLRERLTYESFQIPPDWIRRFQYIRHDASFDSLLTEPFDVDRLQLTEPFDMDRSQAEVRIQRTLLRTTQSIQQQRSEVLSKVLSARDPDLIDGIVNELDEVFITESQKIFYLCLRIKREFVEVVPSIVRDFSDIMESETRRFLITSETVKKFADDYSPGNFDYSAPGCGLWKAIELEVNRSLVLYLRQQRGVVDINKNPWQGIRNRRTRIQIQTGPGPHHWVNLNERKQENKDELSHLMLGSMTYMLKWGNVNGIKRDLENLSLSGDMLLYLLGRDHLGHSVPPLTPNTLPWHLREVGQLRNGHAHTSAMSRERFNELRDLVLPSSSNPETCLVKILQLKRKVYEKFGVSPINTSSILEDIH